MKITVLCVGKIKEKYFCGAIDEYMKRLTRYCKPEIIEVTDEKTPDGASEAEELQIKQKEWERISAKLREGTYVIVLAIEGKQYTSPELAATLDKLMSSGHSDITFIIGGSLGLDERAINRADMLLSFSKMTFPHQLMRVVLLEQVYRSFRIINNEPYHK